MFRYNKTTQCAVAALSRLAEVYDGGRTVSSSVEIAESRKLPKPLVAKLLTVLSQAGLVRGTPGPGGGYVMAKHPAEVSLFDVASLFERPMTLGTCPFGPTWCKGDTDRCPLHEPLMRMHDEMMEFMRNTTFAVFMKEDIIPSDPLDALSLR